MKAIAAEAGTSVAQLYLTFKDKNALALAFRTAENDHMIDAYLRPAMELDLPPWERLLATTEAYLQYYLDEREVATLIAELVLTVDPDDPAITVLVNRQEQQFSRLTALLAEITEDSGVDINPSHVYRWIWASIYGLAIINMRLPHMAVSDAELERTFQLGMGFVRTGLREAGRIR